MKALAVLLLLMSTVALRAEDWTVNGTIYKNVKVVSHDDGFVTVLDDDGGAKIALGDLPPDLQKKFGYDPAKAAKAAADAAAQDQRDKEALAKEQEIADQKKQAEYKEFAKEDAASAAVQKQQATDAALRASARGLMLKVVQVLPDGMLCQEQRPIYGGDTYGGGGGAVLEGYEDSGEELFLACTPGNRAEGEQIFPAAARDGTYTYTDTQGASRTVEKWIEVDK